jgi:transcriptional regulator with PAS, ATPase and Fis domain
VGSREERRFAGRVIAATNRPLEELMSGKGLRQDFLYRISSDRIEVPTLRERLSGAPDELRFLGGHLLERMTGWAGGEEKEQVLTCLEEGVPEGYGWPGNVRELEQALRRILLTGHPGIVPEPQEKEEAEFRSPAVPADLRRMPVAVRARVLRQLYDAYGTYAETARRTGLDRRTVKRWMEEDI